MALEVEASEYLAMQNTDGADVKETPELGVETNFQKDDESYNNAIAVEKEAEKLKVSASDSEKENQKSEVFIEQVSVENNSSEFTGTVGNSNSEDITKGSSFEACNTEEEGKEETPMDSEPEIREKIIKREGSVESDPNKTAHHDLQESTEAVNKEEVRSGDAFEEVCKSPKMSAETIVHSIQGTSSELTALTISSVDNKQSTEVGTRDITLPEGKADKESKLSRDQEEEIMQNCLHEITSIQKGNSFDEEHSEVRDVEQGNNEMNYEASQLSSMLVKPAAEGTLEYVNDETQEENDEGTEIVNSIAPLKAKNDSSMKSTENQEQTETIPQNAEQESNSPQDLSRGKESGYEGMSPQDSENRADKQDESRIINCAEEEADITRESQLSYQEILNPSQMVSGLQEDSVDSSTDGDGTTLMEKKLTDRGAVIKECSENKESEMHESKTVKNSQGRKPEDDSYVDQLSEPARIEATNTSYEVGLAGEKLPECTLENDDFQSCLKESEVDENEIILEMVKQNQSFSESDLHKENIRQKTLISTELGCKFDEENKLCEPYSSDHTACTTKSSVSFSDNAIGYRSDKENASSSMENNKISSLNDSRNKESMDTEVTEARPNMIQQTENKADIILRSHTQEEIADGSYMPPEKQLESLTLEGIKLTYETGLTVDGRQNIPLQQEDQFTDDVRDTAFGAVGKENTNKEKNESICIPDKDTENVYESNNEEIQYDRKPVGNEPHTVKDVEIVNPETEERVKSDHREKNQENSIHDAIETDGDSRDNLIEREPTNLSDDTIKVDERMEEAIFQLEKNNQEIVELHSTRDVMTAKENPEPLGAAGNKEDCTNSTINEDNVTCEANINVCEETSRGVDKQCPESSDHLLHEGPDDNQPLSVTCLDTKPEAEDTLTKTENSEKAVNELQYTEEYQSNTYGTDENFQNVMREHIEDHKNYESTYADPSQLHDETNSNESNITAMNQKFEEGCSSNEEGIRKTDEVSPSQDKCSNIPDNRVHAIEVEESTEKLHEDPEDRITYSRHVDVLVDQSIHADPSDNIQYITNGTIDRENRTTFTEVDNYGSDDHSKVMDCTDKKPPEKLQDVHIEKQVVAMKEVEFEREAEEASDKDRDFDQLTKDLDHNNFPQSIDEGAQKDIQPVLQGTGSDVEEMNVSTMQYSERIGTESRNLKTQKDGKEQEEGENSETSRTADVLDTDTENGRSTGFHSDSGKLDQDITEECRPYSDVENPITTNDDIPRKFSEAVQVIEIENVVAPDCDVSAKEVKTTMTREQKLFEVKPMDIGVDLQQDNESECKQVHDERENEILVDDEIGEPYHGKDKDIINQESEYDQMSSKMPDQETLSAIEASRQNIGAATDDPTQYEPSEILNDKVHTVEVREESGFETAQHIQTNDEAEHADEISSEKTIQAYSVDNLQCITKSAVDCEDETDSHRSEDESKGEDTDSTDRESTQKLHETNSENQDFTIKEEDFATEVQVSFNARNFDQVIKDLEHNNETKSLEKEGVHKDVQQVLPGKGSDVEVIHGKSPSSVNGMDTESSEVKHDEAPSQEEQMSEAPSGKSQTSNAFLDPELGIQEQSTEGEKAEAELDFNIQNVTVKDTELVMSGTSLQEAPQQSNNMKLPVVNSTEESQQKDEEKVTLSDLEDLPLTSQDYYESENVTLAASRPDQSVHEWGPNDANQEENVSNVTISSTNFLSIDDITPDETGEQAVEPHKNLWPPSSASETISISHDEKESSMTLQELNEDKEEQPTTAEKQYMPEETQRELPAAEVVSKAEKSLAPENQGANDPLNSEMVESRSPRDGCPHEIEIEDNQVTLKNDACSEPTPEKHGQACQEVAGSQEETRSSVEVIQLSNEEPIKDIIEERDGHAVKSELTVEESASEESYKSQGLSTYDKTEENIQANSDGKLQCITTSAVDYDDSTIVAETDSHRSEDESKVVDTDSMGREPAQKLHKTYCENQDLTITEEDFVTVAEVTKNFEHKNDTQSIENEGAHEDVKQAFQGEGSDIEEFQEINDKSMQLGEESGTESDKHKVQIDGQKEDKGVCNETAQTTTATDPEKENETPTESHPGSGKVDQEFALESIQCSDDDNHDTSKDKGMENYSKETQVLEQEEEVVSDRQRNSVVECPDINSCGASPKENTEVAVLVEEYKCSFESTEPQEVNKKEYEATNSEGENHGSKNTEHLNVNVTERDLDEDFIVHAEEVRQAKEEPYIYEDCKTTERESTQEDCQQTLADEHPIDQVEHLGTTEAPQLENEGKTFIHDEIIGEAEITHDMHRFNEMNEAGSLKYEEAVNQGFEDDCTIKSEPNTQTSMDTEACEGNISAEMPIQNKEECTAKTENGIKVSGIHNIAEEAENDEQKHEALGDEMNNDTVINGNPLSSGDGLDSQSSEVEHYEPQSQEKQMREASPGKSRTSNAFLDTELGIQKQSTAGEAVEAEPDSIKPNVTAKNMEMVINETSLQEAPQGDINMKLLVQNSTEVSQQKDDEKEMPSELQDLQLTSQDYETENVTLAGSRSNQSVKECQPNDANQEENVLNETLSSLNCHDDDKLAQDETVETQEKQEPHGNLCPPSSDSKSAISIQDKEDMLMTLQELNKDKEEEPSSEMTTQNWCTPEQTQQELPAAAVMSETEKLLVPETQVASDPLDTVKVEPWGHTDGSSHETESEDILVQHKTQTAEVSLENDSCSEPISEKYGQAGKEVTENQEETGAMEEGMELNNEEQAIEDIIEVRGDHAVKSRLIVEESTSKDSYESQEISTYDKSKEVPSSPVEMVEIFSEPMVFKDESTKIKEEIMEETEETNADPEDPKPKFSEIESEADNDEKTLINTEYNTKPDNCSISICKDEKEVSEESNISLVSESKEGEAVVETSQQGTAGERTDNEVKFMESNVGASEISQDTHFPELHNEETQKEKAEEFTKGLDICSSLETLQENDRKWVAEKAGTLVAGEMIGNNEKQGDASSREIDAGQSEAKPDSDKFESGGKLNNASALQIDCQNEKEIIAAEIIASHICLGIETEEPLKTLVTHADEKDFTDHGLHDEKPESTSMSFDNPMELIRSPEVRPREIEHPNIDHEPKQEIEEKLRTMAGSAGLQLEYAESRSESILSGKSKSDADGPPLATLNFKEIYDRNEKGDIVLLSQLNMKSDQIAEESPGKLVTGEIVSSSELQGDVSSREVDAGLLEAKPNLNKIDSGGKFTNANTLQIDCPDDKEITAAAIITNSIYLGIEKEEQVEQLKTLITDADDKTFKGHDLHDEKKEKKFTFFDSPVELICSPKVRQRELEHSTLDDEPIRDLKQKQEEEEEEEERLQTTDGSPVPDLEELSLEDEGVESSSESVPSGEPKSGAEKLPLAISNVREINDSNEKGDVDASPQTNLESHQISEESLRSSCKTSTYNHENLENLEEINEIQREKLATSKEIVKDTPLGKVKDEHMMEKSLLNFEFHNAATTEAAREEDSKSCDEEKKSLMEDKQSVDATFSPCLVSFVKETPAIESNPSEEKDSEQQPRTEHVGNQDNFCTQIRQEDKEERLQDSYEEFHLSSPLQESSGNDPINERVEEVVNTVGDIHNQSPSAPITKSSTLAPVESVTTAKEEIMAEKHNETEVKSTPPESAKTKSNIGNRKEKTASEESKTQKDSENKKNDLREEVPELKPMVLETSRDMELKTQHKKSQNILSGMSSKMKNSISKVKKAMACTSPQFEPDNVIVKLNKNRKS